MENQVSGNTEKEKPIFRLLREFLRSVLLDDLLSSLDRNDIVKINKAFRKLAKAPISSFYHKGRLRPDTFDWRDDREVMCNFLFHRSMTTSDRLFLAALCEFENVRLNAFASLYKDILKNGYLAPKSMIFQMVYEDSTFEEFRTKFSDLVDSINDNKIALNLSFSNAEELVDRVSNLIVKYKDCQSFPNNLRDSLEENLEEIKKIFSSEKVKTNSKEEIQDTTANEQQKTSLNRDRDIQKQEEINMLKTYSEKFLGYIRLQKNFYNFYPVAKINDGVLEPMNSEEAKIKFPSFGAFSLVKNYYKDNVTRTLIDNYFYTIEVGPGDLIPYESLEGTQREDYAFKLCNFHELERKKQFLGITSENYYLIVYPIKEEPDLESNVYVTFNIDGERDLASYAYQRFQVVLAYKNKFLGPVTLLQDANGLPYINFRSGTNDGIVQCFTGENIREAIYSRSIYLHEENNTCARDILDTNQSCVHKSYFDLLSDSKLLKRIAEQSRQYDKKTLSLVKNWLESSLKTEIPGPNEQIRQERRARLSKLLENLEFNEENVDTFVKVVSNSMALAKNDQNGFFDEIVRRIVAQPDALEHIKEFKLIHDQIEVLEQRREHEEKKLEEIKESIAKLNAEKDKQQKEKLEGDLAKITEETEKQKAKLDEVLKALGHVDDLKAIESEVKCLDNRRRELQHNNTILEEEGRDIERHLLNEINNRKIKELAFNPSLAHKFAEAAAQWIREDEEQNLQRKADSVQGIQPDALTGENLVEYLVSQTQRYRNHYDRNTVLNLYICLAQNLLTVLAGKPGSGKTSICHIMAHVLGATSLDSRACVEDINRFLPVSVERGWTSKRDFLGYYNPLTKHFETIDSRRYGAFQLLDVEARANSSKFPYIVLLDEANLSPMEYYWSDFMNAGTETGCVNSLSLGDGKIYKIPQTLRFIATVNNDQTTESLSPRLIDRSWIVTLPEPNWSNFTSFNSPVPNSDDENVRIISWNALQEIFSYNNCWKDIELYEEKIGSILSDVYSNMKLLGLNPSPRTQKSIINYIAAATKWFEKESEQTFSFNAAIDYAVLQKLLPSITVVGSKYKERLKELQNLCESNDLTLSAQTLSNIIEKGDSSMNLYSFF